MPKAVTAFGYSKVTNRPDHLISHYEFDGIPLVVAEGSWCMADGFDFSMAYTVNFERATAICDSSAQSPLVLCQNGERKSVDIEPLMGYDYEIEYFLNCVAQGKKPERVTLRDAVNSVRIVEAEVKSLELGEKITL